jgi:hypothetical protein
VGDELVAIGVAEGNCAPEQSDLFLDVAETV